MDDHISERRLNASTCISRQSGTHSPPTGNVVSSHVIERHLP